MYICYYFPEAQIILDVFGNFHKIEQSCKERERLLKRAILVSYEQLE